jgi:Tol biopolymer transport system component
LVRTNRCFLEISDRTNPRVRRAVGAALPIVAAMMAVGLGGASVAASRAGPLPDLIALSGSPNGKGPSQVYLLNLDSGKLRRLTRGRGDHRALAWSADGSRLLVGQRSGLYAVRANGSRQVRLTSGGDGLNAAWSPSGKSLAFRAAGGLYVVDSSGHHKRLLARGVVGGGFFTGNVSWSPDGSQIAFARKNGIFLVRSDGRGGARRIAIRPRIRTHCCAGPSTFLQPSWSPRGSRIAFVVDNAKTGGYAIYVMKPDGTQATRLQSGHGPVWSPDGSRIAYRNKGDQVMRADGTQVRRWRACWCGISFSPNGSRLAYPGGRVHRSSGALFLASSDGSGKSRILYAPGGVFKLPLWRRGTATTEGG